MSRVKLTEFKAKQLLYQALNIPYHGVAAHVNEQNKIVFTTPLSLLSQEARYVVKLDQGVKGRLKKGLVKLGVRREEIEDTIDQIVKKGYSRFIIEEMVPHEVGEECYLSLERTREGILALYSQKGGINIEENAKDIKRAILSNEKTIANEKLESELGLPAGFMTRLSEFFDKYYVSFLEINPLVINLNNIHILDLAVEVDSTAQFFVKNDWPASRSLGEGWGEENIVGELEKTAEEIAVKKLNARSQAALSFKILNPDGAIWLLLSGGGASITIADEFYNLGLGREVGNYGEYSGNPSAEETYLYTIEFLKAMLKSQAQKKVIVIGGGVANFTDVRITFQGILKAFAAMADQLKKQKILVFVRRGGPRQAAGLQMMRDWLKEHGLYGLVAGPELPLHEIVKEAIKELQKNSA